MSGNKDIESVWRAIHATDERVTALHADMHETVTTAVKAAMPRALLNDDEYRWVQLAIKRESQTIAFRQAVIEKTLMGLIWAAVVGAGLILKEYAQNHGWKP